MPFIPRLDRQVSKDLVSSFQRPNISERFVEMDSIAGTPTRPFARYSSKREPSWTRRGFSIFVDSYLDPKPDERVYSPSTLASRHRFCHFTISLASSEKCLPRPRPMTRRIL